MTSTTAVDEFLAAIENAAIPGCDVWSADATLDATVPNWRLHRAGPDAIRAEYARWFADRPASTSCAATRWTAARPS